MTAAASGNVVAVRELAARGADVNAKDDAQGQTPLMFAAAANRAASVDLPVPAAPTMSVLVPSSMPPPSSASSSGMSLGNFSSVVT